MIFGVPMGILADRKGKKMLMIIALATSAISMIGITFANSFLYFLVSVVLFEIGLATYSPAALALLSDSVPSVAPGVSDGDIRRCIAKIQELWQEHFRGDLSGIFLDREQPFCWGAWYA